MAVNDTHYNGTPDMNQANNRNERSNCTNRNGNQIQMPIAADISVLSEEGGEAVIPLPNPGEGGPVYPGNGGANTPVIPLPNPGEGGPVYPGNGGANTPVIPLPNPGEGGPVYPGNGDANTPVIPLPNPGEGGPVYPGNGGMGCTICPILPSLPNINPQYFGQVRFLNAASDESTFNISIDETIYALNSRFGTITNYDWVSDGFHTVTVRRGSSSRYIVLQQTFPFVAGQKVTMVLTDSANGGLEMIRVVDTGCTNLPANTGCYRFGNMAYSGSHFDLLLYGGETVFRNVGFQTVTSYKQAVAGTYQFYVTNSNSYTFLREIPIIVIGAIGTTTNNQEPLLSLQTDISAGKNYTSYIIGNTWSDIGLRMITVED